MLKRVLHSEQRNIVSPLAGFLDQSKLRKPRKDAIRDLPPSLAGFTEAAKDPTPHFDVFDHLRVPCYRRFTLIRGAQRLDRIAQIGSGKMAPDARQRSILERLTVVGNSVLAELDLETVLGYVVEAARDLTGAQYAALGVLDDEGQELERFIHRGIDGQTREEIGALPRGRGVLGELIREPKPLRMPDVEAHPHAYGFPPGHPPMRSFLGVPVYIGDQIYGNLYLTEKRDAVEFDADDEEAVIVLASWAGIAIKNARLHTVLRGREKQLEVALRRSEAALEIARVIGGETDVNRVVELIVKRARALIEAKTVLVLLRHGDVLDVFAQAGVAGRELAGESIPIAPFRAAIEDHRASLVPAGAPLSEARLRERVGAASALVVPLLFRGTAVGVLVAFDRETGEFDDEDLHLLESFAGSAATAIGTAHVQTAESL